jgi:hypothetical protein
MGTEKLDPWTLDHNAEYLETRSVPSAVRAQTHSSHRTPVAG